MFSSGMARNSMWEYQSGYSWVPKGAQCFTVSPRPNVIAEREGVRDRTARCFHWPLADGEWSFTSWMGLRTVLPGFWSHGVFRHWGAAVTKGEFAHSGRLLLTFICWSAWWRITPGPLIQRHGYTRSFLKVIITKALLLSWTIKSWVKMTASHYLMIASLSEGGVIGRSRSLFPAGINWGELPQVESQRRVPGLTWLHKYDQLQFWGWYWLNLLNMEAVVHASSCRISKWT